MLRQILLISWLLAVTHELNKQTFICGATINAFHKLKVKLKRQEQLRDDFRTGPYFIMQAVVELSGKCACKHFLYGYRMHNEVGTSAKIIPQVSSQVKREPFQK